MNTAYSDIVIVRGGPDTILDGGFYDMTRFSTQETAKIKETLDFVKNNYPSHLYSVGLAEHSFGALYKPRYILNEIVVQLFGSSSNAIDMLSVALAYSTKGAAFRSLSIEYFERAFPHMNNDLLGSFGVIPPDMIYLTFAELYEKEHHYQTALSLIGFANMYRAPEDRELLQPRISKLTEKIANPPRRRRRSQSEDDIRREEQVHRAAEYFISLYWN